MKSTLKTFLNNSFLVNLLSAAIILLGIISLFNMKRDLVPQWKINQITVSSILPGASAEQVEDFVTFPIEEAIQNFAGIDEIKSNSNEGTSKIEVKVKQELTDFEINDLYQLIQATVNNIQNELPEDLEELKVVNEKLTDFWFSSLSVLNFNNEKGSHRRWLKTFSEDLRKIPGIVRVTNRSKTPQLLIQYKQEELSRYHLTPEDIRLVLGKKLRPLPIGSFEQGENTIAVQLKGRVLGLDDVKNVIVKGNGSGTLIRLNDVADVRFQLPEEKYKSFTNGVPSLNVVLFKDLETDTLDTKVKVEKILKEHNEKVPDGLKIQITDDGPAYIERQLNVLNSNAILGVALVTLVLFMFLGLKTSMMTTFGLPLAYFATFIVLDFLGIKIDIISVVGMILILGILVDDAIIVSEQYMQFLEEGLTPYDAAYEAAAKTFVPILGTVLTTIVAFSPILMANDGLSQFLRAIPWVVFAALGMSLIESFLILPNHLAHFVKKPVPHKEGGVFQRSKRGYTHLLKSCLKWRYPLIILFVGFAGFSFWFAQEKVPFKFNLRIGSEK
ncbi:MAG: efflux RND transporter permease subunit, partial [Halobacteriovoraceae bacterium]|nr:efflux RND transporter permease subunit [Halobacteriovoraceae bacterium]